MKPVFSTQTDMTSPHPSILTTSGLESGAVLIASGSREEQAEFLSELTAEELRALPYLFEFWALPHQVPPEGDWKTWVIMGGRGAGKTRAGAEWIRSQVEGALPESPGLLRRLAIIAETYDQARDVMVFGESGIIACTPPDRTPKWVSGERKLVWPNGAEARVYSAHDFEALRGPQFDGAWADELGCAAIDKGTNQPNRFLDPKSSESGLPRASNGGRDDLIQMQYLRAMREFWDAPENNPVSDGYGAQMVDPSRIFVWAWDARPYPFFPGDAVTWSDGENYGRGHWLTGRATSRSLAGVVREICEKSGIQEVDTDRLYGIVRGFAPAPGEGARASLQNLLLAYGADALDRDGTLVFRNRAGALPVTLTQDDLAWGEGTSLVSSIRAPEAEVSGRIRLGFVEADSDYEIRSVESVFPDVVSTGVAESEMPLALTSGEARAAVDRWLAESRIARDRATFAVPPSRDLAAGDVVRLVTGAVQGTFRVDRIEDGGLMQIEAVRVEPGVYETGPVDDAIPVSRPVAVPLPVWSEVLDLPALAATDASEAPWIAAASEPWPGEVAVYSSRDGASWAYDTSLTRRAIMGLTFTELTAAEPGLWDRGAGLSVRLVAGSLSSIDEAAVFSGGNTAVLIAPGGGQGEVFQFRDVSLTGPETWSLSMRLRGQHGTDALMPPVWPVGTALIVLDLSIFQLPLASAALEGPRLYRVGPASKAVDHASFVQISHQASGLALKPYAPAHLRAVRQADGAFSIRWMRRSRIDGDSWLLEDIPLGEASEAYRLHVVSGGILRRDVTLTEPAWLYDTAAQAADGLGATFTIEVAQISDRVGPGHFARIEIHG